MLAALWPAVYGVMIFFAFVLLHPWQRIGMPEPCSMQAQHIELADIALAQEMHEELQRHRYSPFPCCTAAILCYTLRQCAFGHSMWPSQTLHKSTQYIVLLQMWTRVIQIRHLFHILPLWPSQLATRTAIEHCFETTTTTCQC